MRMYDLNLRDRFYNQGDCHSVLPILRRAVVPGQSVEISGRIAVQSAVLDSRVLGPALAEAMFFYVPNRLVWDDWPGFIVQDDDFSGTFPSGTNNWNFVFDRGAVAAGQDHSYLYRRAYKLCYNQFFGSSEFNSGAVNSWYDDITNDTDTVRMRTRRLEQWVGNAELDTAMSEPTFDATTTPINLNDFYRQLVQARQQRRAQGSGDKYVDALRRCGVNPDWRIQQAPEFLGKVSSYVYPGQNPVTAETTGLNIGDDRSRYKASLDVQLKRKSFAEHGYLVGVVVFRPVSFSDSLGTPPDALAQSVEDFWLGDELARDFLEVPEAFVSNGSGQSLFMGPYAYLKRGQHIYGGSGDWISKFSVGNAEDAVFGNHDALSVTDELAGDQIAAIADFRLTGRTPVPSYPIAM